MESKNAITARAGDIPPRGLAPHASRRWWSQATVMLVAEGCLGGRDLHRSTSSPGGLTGNTLAAEHDAHRAGNQAEDGRVFSTPQRRQPPPNCASSPKPSASLPPAPEDETGRTAPLRCAGAVARCSDRCLALPYQPRIYERAVRAGRALWYQWLVYLGAERMCCPGRCACAHPIGIPGARPDTRTPRRNLFAAMSVGTEAITEGGRTAWARNLAAPVRSFLSTETGGAIVMLGAAIVALLWANSPWWHSYKSVWSTRLAVEIGSAGIATDLRHWVNEGLMTLFFLVVGLEAKRQLDLGELRERRRLAIPVVAAIGGVSVPILIYLAFNAGGAGAHGWGAAM
jgi:hypothetical protein